MKVCIAEKPSVAKELAQIIGANTRRDGYFEGNGYQVTWTFGHLCTLKEPNDYTEQWKSWNFRSLPMIPPKFGIKLIENDGVKKQFTTIEKLMSTAEEVINCGDAGQEGELIQRWVMSLAKCTAPVKRLWISSLTEEAIREGFLKLQSGGKFDNLYFAGSARAIGDWLLGMNATRLYTLKYGQNKQVLSIGRVQTPTGTSNNYSLSYEVFSSEFSTSTFYVVDAGRKTPFVFADGSKASDTRGMRPFAFSVSADYKINVSLDGALVLTSDAVKLWRTANNIPDKLNLGRVYTEVYEQSNFYMDNIFLTLD